MTNKLSQGHTSGFWQTAKNGGPGRECVHNGFGAELSSGLSLPCEWPRDTLSVGPGPGVVRAPSVTQTWLESIVPNIFQTGWAITSSFELEIPLGQLNQKPRLFLEFSSIILGEGREHFIKFLSQITTSWFDDLIQNLNLWLNLHESRQTNVLLRFTAIFTENDYFLQTL